MKQVTQTKHIRCTNSLKSYLKEVQEFVKEFGYDSVKGMCHITGGSLYENMSRIIP